MQWPGPLFKSLCDKRKILCIKTSLRPKGTLISEPRFSTPCEMRFFPREKGKTAFSRKNPRQRPFSLFSRGKNRISQGVEDRGSLISVPLGLRAVRVTLSGSVVQLFSCAFWASKTPDLLFLAFLENGKEKHQKNKDFCPRRTPKILGKKGKNAQKNKEFLGKEKSKEIQKSKEKKIRDLA